MSRLNFKLTVEYICRDMCEDTDLIDKTPYDILDEILEGSDYYRLVADKVALTKVEVLKNESK